MCLPYQKCYSTNAERRAEFVKNALAFFWRFSGCVWHFFGTFLTSFGIFSDFQSGNPAVGVGWCEKMFKVAAWF